MDGDLHQAISQTNYAIGSLIDANFWQEHGMDPLVPLETARKWLIQVSEHLDAYEATIRIGQKVAA